MSSDRFLIRQGQKIYFRGIKGIITNTSNPIWITVTDENGMERSIKRSLLVSNPLFKFFQDAIDRNNEKIDEYDEKVAQLNLLRKNSLALQRQKRHEMRAYLSKCGVNLATQLNGQDMSYYNNGAYCCQ